MEDVWLTMLSTSNLIRTDMISGSGWLTKQVATTLHWFYAFQAGDFLAVKAFPSLGHTGIGGVGKRFVFFQTAFTLLSRGN